MRPSRADRKTPPVAIRTRRWNDPGSAGDGLRVLVCRYRPRGVRKEDETWDVWRPDLGPSRELHAAFWGKNGPPIGWDEYRKRYLAEMADREAAVEEVAAVVRRGEPVALLCSSACVDETRCHRTLLKDLVERRAAARPFIERHGAAAASRRPRARATRKK
jgi:uncharacterized protein YeaO (DUF488 family)